MNNNYNSTENDIIDIDVKSQLEHQIQIRETKESGWIFDKINSMEIRFHTTGELNSSTFVRIPLRSSALLNNQNVDNYCFIRSKLASLHPCDNSPPTRVKNYSEYFNELNIKGFDFTNGFKYSDVRRFIELYNLTINILELNFYQDKSKLKQNLIPIEISKSESDKFNDLLTYKNQYTLVKKLNVFLGDHYKFLSVDGV